ncbi:MAG: helix-turn-helix domain-containing protein [Bacteroidales bacterium]|nr:helix-turn-helix domain-containing protein [Bacteroidales bacterium]
MEIGKLIKELRIKKGLTQEELAEKTEVSTRTIQRIENGVVDPRAYTLQMIAKALDVNFNLFVDESNKNEVIEEANSNIWLGFLHLSGLLPLFFPAIILWHQRKNKTKDMTIHYNAVLSMQFCILGICLGGFWIYWKMNMLTPLIGTFVAGAMASIFNAVNVMNGNFFINPFIKTEKKTTKRSSTNA